MNTIALMVISLLGGWGAQYPKPTAASIADACIAYMAANPMSQIDSICTMSSSDLGRASVWLSTASSRLEQPDWSVALLIRLPWDTPNDHVARCVDDITGSPEARMHFRRWVATGRALSDGHLWEIWVGDKLTRFAPLAPK